MRLGNPLSCSLNDITIEDLNTDKYTITPTHPVPLQPLTSTADKTHSTSQPSIINLATTATDTPVDEFQDIQVLTIGELQDEEQNSNELLVATDPLAVEEQSSRSVDQVDKPVSLLLEREKTVSRVLSDTGPGIAGSGDCAKPVKRGSNEVKMESPNQNAPFGGALSLARIQSLVSMTTPRNFGQPGVTSSPPFVEFDLSIDGFGSLFLPSVFPISVDQVYIFVCVCVCVCVCHMYICKCHCISLLFSAPMVVDIGRPKQSTSIHKTQVQFLSLHVGLEILTWKFMRSVYLYYYSLLQWLWVATGSPVSKNSRLAFTKPKFNSQLDLTIIFLFPFPLRGNIVHHRSAVHSIVCSMYRSSRLFFSFPFLCVES